MKPGADTEEQGTPTRADTLGGRAVTLASLLTDDGVRIEAAYRPAADPAPDPADDVAIVVAHGFTGALRRPAVLRAAEVFTRYGAVVTFSFRGHGRSGGRSTVGGREVLDLDAAVRWARAKGHTRVAAVGFSMGGSVVLRQAGLRTGDVDIAGALDAAAAGAAGALDTEAAGAAGGGSRLTGRGRAAARASGGREGPEGPEAGRGSPETGGRGAASVDAVVAVSSPARWYYRGTPPMRRLHWALSGPAGRLVSRAVFRTRIDPRGWGPAPDLEGPPVDIALPTTGGRGGPGPDPVPVPPVEIVRRIPPTPLLVVHGDRDAYFPLDHPRSLAEAAGDGCELWIEHGFGHAENAAEPELLHRVGAWLMDHTG